MFLGLMDTMGLLVLGIDKISVHFRIIIIKMANIVVICLFTAVVHLRGLYQQVGVVYSEVVAIYFTVYPVLDYSIILIV